MSNILENNDIGINENLINLDFRNKDILYFLKGSFLDKKDNSIINLRYDHIEIEENNYNYSSIFFYLDNLFRTTS